MLSLRAPRWAFGVLALALYFIASLGVAVAILSGGRLYTAPQAQVLMWPAAIATIIVGGAIGPRLRRGEINRRLDVIARAAMCGGVAGFAWPLSFAASAAMHDGWSAIGAVLAPCAVGFAIGAVSGAVGGAIAAFAVISAR